MCSIDLIESPEQVFGCTVDIVAARVVREVVAKRGSRKLRLEEIDLVEEQDDTSPHKPSTVNDRVEEYQALHHAVLRHESVGASPSHFGDVLVSSPPTALGRTRSMRRRK
jgi:hypothetical protein